MVVEKMVTRNGSPVMRCLLISLLQGHPCNRLSAEEGLLKMADLEKRCANWYMWLKHNAVDDLSKKVFDCV